MNNKSEVVFILDKSGSMYERVEDSIGGYNQLIDHLKESNASMNITTILFSSDMEYLARRKDLSKVKHLSRKDYEVNGCTALYDAIGLAITDLAEAITDDTEVSFFITTDGEENDSRLYTQAMIQKMIEYHSKYENWNFHFLAQGIDSSEGEELGIDCCINCEDDLYEVMEDLLLDDLEDD